MRIYICYGQIYKGFFIYAEFNLQMQQNSD